MTKEVVNIFYNKYSNYSFSQLSNDMYKKAVEDILKKAQNNDDIENKLRGILYEGGYDDFAVNSGMTRPDNIKHEIDRRLNFAGLLISDPKTFEAIAQNNVILFHGTNSNALPEILKNGLQSESETISRGKEVLTGETSLVKPREFISFTDKLSLALDYATLKPSTKTSGNSSYGVLIGVSTNDLDEDNNEILTANIGSDTPEIGVMKKLPANYIRVIAVPGSKVQEVNKMVQEYGLDEVSVVPADGIVNSVALTESYSMFPNKIDLNCLIINGSDYASKTFKKEDIRKVAEDRSVGKIKKLYLQLRNKILKDKEMENYVSRDE